MLVLNRKKGESIRICDDIVVTVIEVRRDRVRLGIQAPSLLRIYREEVARRIQLEIRVENLDNTGVPNHDR